jgi:hypothetical protein
VQKTEGKVTFFQQQKEKHNATNSKYMMSSHRRFQDRNVKNKMQEI